MRHWVKYGKAGRKTHNWKIVIDVGTMRRDDAELNEASYLSILCSVFMFTFCCVFDNN